MTPDQLEEFEAVFLHFDRERSNSLGNGEFGAALASLGLNYEPDEMEQIFSVVSGGRGRVNFEQFIRFMVILGMARSDDRLNCTKTKWAQIKFEPHFRMLQTEK